MITIHVLPYNISVSIKVLSNYTVCYTFVILFVYISQSVETTYLLYKNLCPIVYPVEFDWYRFTVQSSNKTITKPRDGLKICPKNLSSSALSQNWVTDFLLFLLHSQSPARFNNRLNYHFKQVINQITNSNPCLVQTYLAWLNRGVKTVKWTVDNWIGVLGVCCFFNVVYFISLSVKYGVFHEVRVKGVKSFVTQSWIITTINSREPKR